MSSNHYLQTPPVQGKMRGGLIAWKSTRKNLETKRKPQTKKMINSCLVFSIVQRVCIRWINNIIINEAQSSFPDLYLILVIRVILSRTQRLICFRATTFYSSLKGPCHQVIFVQRTTSGFFRLSVCSKFLFRSLLGKIGGLELVCWLCTPRSQK